MLKTPKLPLTAPFLLAFSLLALLIISCGVVAGPGPTAAVEPEVIAPPAQPPAVAHGEPLTLGFPRLGMWWPDPWEQPLEEIARYDWVILGDWDTKFITPLRTLNSDIILLNSTNACELDFDPDAPPEENGEVLAIPPEWFLTQVGSTLADPVDAVTTTFHVAAITATDGISTYELFVISDTVLIEGESVLIEAVDEGNRTLTVRRGYVRPASPHAAGTHLAAHISFWPHSWMLNLSTLCPTAVVSPVIGPETWADYNARVAVGLLANPLWDGLLIDRSDPNESWLIGNSTARTIDPDQSDTLLSDYGEFDEAWNEGLRQYESLIRQAVGDERIIFVNWGMANYDLLNGNNFEGFPDDDGGLYDTPWQAVTMGPFSNGSYFDWLEHAQQPNLTMIETYEDDGGPDATGNGEYDNPCDDPGFVPNYRKMRFGLATALLHDGFYSYEINTNGHGSLCLLWFDEYDNAGAGRSYLGQPLGPAYRVADNTLGDNQLAGAGFDSQDDLDRWGLWVESGYTATLSLDTTNPVVGSGAARIDVTQAQGTDWEVALSFEPVEVVSGTDYTISFWARAERERPLSLWVQQAEDPWETYIWVGELVLTAEWQQYVMTTASVGSDTAAEFDFGLGQVTGTVWLDDVRLQEGSNEVWRRDYENGAVLLNATSVTQTIPLHTAMRHIAGTQDPAINDGRVTTKVVLPPHDGLILLREQMVYLPIMLDN